MIAIILSIICFLTIFKVLKSTELRECRDEWKPFKMTRWLWILTAIGCFLPVFNLFFTVVFLIIVFTMTRTGDARFKGGKKTWLDKIIDFFSKEV